MCLIWTQKYLLCGCIWNIRDLYCKPTEICWGARMVVINCHLQTCKECWRSGDKRIDQEVANLMSQQKEAEQRRKKSLPEEEEESFHCEVDSNYDSNAEEDFEALHPSRPTTPELDLDPQKLPQWLFGAEVMGDATRACEPVKLEKIWKNYRARREKTDWYLVEGKSA